MVVTRIAPTPSGFLHAGNIHNFKLIDQYVKEHAGKLILRIDDSDEARVRDEYLTDIFRVLEELKIKIDEGPTSPEDFKAKYSQSLRLAEYDLAVESLKKKGLLFACACSRKDIQKQSSDGRYPGTCRDKGLDLEREGLTLRFNSKCAAPIRVSPQGDQHASIYNLEDTMGDFVVRKRDGQASYQVVSLLEDVRLGVNTIIRGEDLFSSTLAQMAMAKSLGLEDFLKVTFIHHELIRDENGQKLSKST
ncbi:tRNA glutamyl-Q synthetase [bacterium]|nr:tRNA glutamyl-Q synthetase [bacterium]